jgi:glucokinase
MNQLLASVEPDSSRLVSDAREVISLWLAWNTVAREVMEEVISALGTGIANLIHIFNPELIVIGGGVADAGEIFFSRVRKEAEKRTMPSIWAGVRINRHMQY